MVKKKDVEAVRIRLTIPRDADGLVEYLKACDPKTLSTTVYQLVYLGFLTKQNRLRLDLGVGTPTVSALTQTPAAAQGGSLPPDGSKANVASGASLDDELNSFGVLFGDTFRQAAR